MRNTALTTTCNVSCAGAYKALRKAGFSATSPYRMAVQPYLKQLLAQ